MQADAQTRGLVLVACAGVFWSLQGVTIRLVEDATPAQIVFWRSVSQLIAIVAVIAVASRGQVLATVRRAGGLGLVGGVCGTVAGVSFVYAVTHTSIANVVFIMASSPLFAGLGAWLLMGERLGTRTLGAMLIALAGIGVMMWEGIAGDSLTGYLFAISTTVGFAGIAVVARRGGDRNMTPMVAWGALFNLCLFGALLGDAIAVSGRDLAICFLSGGVLTAGGATCFMQGARFVPAGVLAFLSLTETVLAPIWAWIGFHETPSTYTFIGGSVVLGAIVFETAMRVRGARRGTGARSL